MVGFVAGVGDAPVRGPRRMPARNTDGARHAGIGVARDRAHVRQPFSQDHDFALGRLTRSASMTVPSAKVMLCTTAPSFTKVTA